MTPVLVALDPGITPWLPEVTWTIRTLLHVAGHGATFRVLEQGTADIYYGRGSGVDAPIRLPWGGGHFGYQGLQEPGRLFRDGPVPLLDFGAADRIQRQSDPEFARDVVLASFWLLTNPVETLLPRSRTDDLDFSGTLHVQERLFELPLVSIWAMALRRRLAAAGKPGRPLPWSATGEPAFVFTHDVDYPEIIRWIEAPRALTRGRGALAWQIASGRSHFWTFREWIDLVGEFGAAPAFYFMARRGSLAQYALGTPDDFYDVRSARFRSLFGELREAGCEIGLHASYHAHRRAATLTAERQRLQEATGTEIHGNRNHYWHLDPDAPHETLRKLAAAGFVYDSSLGLEYYPGWRRGICHPFRPWHPGLRREAGLLELPPTWMDDHFGRRRVRNGVTDPDATAGQLLEQARAVSGLVIVDYHSRGMNADIYPEYGPWLARFVRERLRCGWRVTSPMSIAEAWNRYTASLDALAGAGLPPRIEPAGVPAGAPASSGATTVSGSLGRDPAAADLRVGPLAAGDEARWEAFVLQHPDRTPYHLLAWREVTREGFGHDAHHLVARDAGGEVVGVLPLFLVRGIFGSRLVSVPMRDRGGVLATTSAVAARLVAAAIDLARDLDVRYLELKSPQALAEDIVRAHDLHVASQWVTTQVDLSRGRDALWKAFDKDAVRWTISRARREGVVVEQVEDEAGVRRFHDLFVRTRLHMGIPPFPLALFTSLWRHFVQRDRGQLLLVRRQQDWIGGLLSVWADHETFLPAYAAPQHQFRRLYPSESVFWTSMEWAIEHGFRTYDFGADSPRQTGLLWFKRKWTGVPRLVNYYYWCADGVQPPNFDSSSRAYTAARQAWRLLPHRVAQPVGAWVTRQLS